MSFFSEEATLFSREYEVVEAMRTAWSADVQRFFDVLHPAVAGHLGVRLYWEVDRTQTQHRSWWIESETPKMGTATLWYRKEYPELIRDRLVLWYAYLDVQGRPAPEALQATWRIAAEAELRTKESALTLELGPINGYQPLLLSIPWKDDPVSDTAHLIAYSLQAIHRAASKLKEPR